MTSRDVPRKAATADGGRFTVKIGRLSSIADDVVLIALHSAAGGELPAWTPGAHIDVHLGGGLIRQYSLCGDPSVRSEWRIAVLKEKQSRGGSLALHTQIAEGQALEIGGPRNNFPLVDADDYILIAGGIGVTPIRTMAQALAWRGKHWKMLYGGRTRSAMAFLPELSAFGDRVCIRPEDEFGLLDIVGWVGQPRLRTAIYCCGPEPLIKAVESACADWPDDALQVERFKPAVVASVANNRAFEVVLARAGVTLRVGADQTIADTVERAGIYIPRSCNEGTCGTCLTKLIAGTPDHRDSFLREKQKKANTHIMPCCSRSLSETLVLDL